jgi:hypothetical protein
MTSDVDFRETLEAGMAVDADGIRHRYSVR